MCRKNHLGYQKSVHGFILVIKCACDLMTSGMGGHFQLPFSFTNNVLILKQVKYTSYL